MNRSLLLMAVGAVSLVVIGLVVGSLLQQASTSASDDGGEPAKPIVQPENATDLLISLGVKDEEQTPWKGEIKVSDGEILNVAIVRAARNSSVDGSKFNVRAARQQNRQRLAPAQLHVSLNAPPSATVEIETSRGKFSFALSQLAPGSSRAFLDGGASVALEEGALCLTGPETEDDFPAMATAPDGTIWLAYVEYKPGPELINERVLAGNFEALEPTVHGDRIMLRRFDGKTWHPPINLTDPKLDVWRPAVTVDGKGMVWVMWAQKVDGDWEIMAQRHSAKGLGGTNAKRLTKSPGSDFHAVATTDSNGKVWLSWQAWRDGNYEILVSSADEEGNWTKPATVSRSKANDWSPSMAADAKGNVYVAWDTYDKGNYDVWLARMGGEGREDFFAAFPIATSPRFEARPCVMCDAAGRVWIAYEEGDQQWGKDYATAPNNVGRIGLKKENPGFALYVNRTVKVKCFVDGKLKQPAGDLEAAFKGNLTRGKSVPRLGVDKAGGVWLLVRHHPQAQGNGETWHSYALRYDGRQWSKPRHLSNSSNLLDNRPALAAHGDGLLAVYSGDYRTRTQDRKQDDLFSVVLADDGETFDAELADDQPAAEEALATVHPNEAADVARLRNYRVKNGSAELRPLRGEFHRHTEYTAHRDQDGLLEDAWRYALDAGNLDWMGNGDHDNGYGHEYLWWQIQKITDLHHNPPHFVAAMTYERSLQYPNGHRNVMMPRRGIRPLPRGSLDSTPEEGTVDTKILYAYLKHYDGICASHTSGTNMGTDWRDNDPLVEPIVEIYQGHRHNYEHKGAPRAPTAETQIGGYQEAGYVWNALEKGYKLGFQSSSDHVSTHMSYAIVLAEDTSREAIIDAFKQRHCYAATDNILLVVRSGEQLMGDVFETDAAPQISIEVHGTGPIANVHLIRDNKYVYTVEPDDGEMSIKRTYTDKDIKAGGTSYYYVRVEQEDGNLAWASPMWIKYKP